MQGDIRLKILQFLNESDGQVDFFTLVKELDLDLTELAIELDVLIHEKRFVSLVGLGSNSSYAITSAGIEELRMLQGKYQKAPL